MMNMGKKQGEEYLSVCLSVRLSMNLTTRAFHGRGVRRWGKHTVACLCHLLFLLLVYRITSELEGGRRWDIIRQALKHRPLGGAHTREVLWFEGFEGGRDGIIG